MATGDLVSATLTNSGAVNILREGENGSPWRCAVARHDADALARMAPELSAAEVKEITDAWADMPPLVIED